MESAFAPIKASIENAAALNQQIVRLQDQAEDLVRMPEDLSNLMRSIMGSVAATDTPASDRSKVFSDFYDSLYLEPESVSTTTRQAVEDNRAALDDYAHQLAVINDASVSTSRVFDTLDDAETARDAIADRLDDQAETAPDDLYDDLMALRSSLVQAIPPEGATLPDLVTIKEQATLPAVVLAYRLYADATRDEEIVTRNRVRHPSFVPGGVDLEVLTSG